MAATQHKAVAMLLLVGLLVCTPALAAQHQPHAVSRKLLDTQSVQSTQSTNAADGWLSNTAHAAWEYWTGEGGSQSSNGPCIECQDCTTNNCFSVCQRSCSNPPPPQPIVNGNDCKAYGEIAGVTVAKNACNTAMLYCNGGQRPLTSFFPVTLSQCANIAYGVCQQQATSPWSVSCSSYWSLGYQQCSGSQFWEFYQGEVNDRCNQQVANIN
eukprot:GHUV01000116.1.p1 GENE.GHUV01000116.1~~GHUV01000116.1.p1  ORF type:complete len:212 (+),score=44.59 GHUV01000116.1:194-829(+)